MGESFSMSSRQGGSRYPSAFGQTPTSLLTSTDFKMPAIGGSSTSSSAQKVSSYSSSYSSSSRDGGRPVTEYSTDSTYKSTTTGPSGIPHTSYGHSSSNYSSENPYKNRVSSYSYNI